jgi:hypothetical protein
MTDVTRILNAIDNRDEKVVDQLILTIYQELWYLTTNELQKVGIIGLLSEIAEICYRNMEIKEYEKPVPLDTFIAIPPTAHKG